jgi:ribosomal protein S18 acetylase RimI-like enzyme
VPARSSTPLASAAEALDANFGELLAWYSSWPGGEVRRDEDLLLTWSGVPFRAINAAALADLTPAAAARRIDEAVGWLTARGDRWRWLVGPTSRPADLERRLLASGLRQVGDSPGMALDLRYWRAGASTRTGAPTPDGLAIDPVSDEAGLVRWREVQQRGLGLDGEASEAWWVAHRRPGFDPALPLRNWVASLDGVAVAAAALFVGAGIAGVYNVCTVPEARGRGIAGAVTAAALDEAASRGLRLAALGSSDMGYPVYRRLGFRDVSRLRSYGPA